MDIYILEDNLIQQGRLERVLSQELKKYNKDLSIVHTFDKPKQLIEAFESTTSNQLFFLDIEIKGEKLKGLETELCQECRIILNGEERWVRNVVMRGEIEDSEYAMIFLRDITESKAETMR